MTTDEKLDRILFLLEKLVGDEPEELCDHTTDDFVSDDGWVHCKHCDMRLERGA